MKLLKPLLIALLIAGCFESTPADNYLTVICIDGHYDAVDLEFDIRVGKSEFGNAIIWTRGPYGWHGKDLVANYEWYAKGKRDEAVVEEYLAWKRRHQN